MLKSNTGDGPIDVLRPIGIKLLVEDHRQAVAGEMDVSAAVRGEAERQQFGLVEDQLLDWLHDGETVTIAKVDLRLGVESRSEEHTSALQSLMSSSYTVFC